MSKLLINASSPLRLTDKDGKRLEFQVRDLTDRDILELDEWVQARYIAVARASLPPDATDDQRRFTLGVAMDRAVGLSWFGGAGARIVATPLGWAQIVWRMARQDHPEITLDRVVELMFNPENRDASADKLNEFSDRRQRRKEAKKNKKEKRRRP